MPLLRPVIAVTLQQALGHQNIHIGHMTVRPLSQITITDLQIGPPRGFYLPLLTVNRIVIAYDLSKIFSNHITVRSISISQPRFFIETRNNKTNLQAFIDGIPKAPQQPEEPTTPPELVVELTKLAIANLAVYSDNAQTRVMLRDVSLKASGRWNGDDSFAMVQAEIGDPHHRRTTLGIINKVSPQLTAELNLTLRTLIGLQKLRPLKTILSLDIHAKSHRLTTTAPLPTLDLSSHIKLAFDQRAQRVDLTAFKLRAGETELADLTASIDGILWGNRRATLHLRRLFLPLDQFATWSQLIEPRAQFGGVIRSDGLVVRASMADLLSGHRPEVGLQRGNLVASDLWASWTDPHKPSHNTQIRDLNLQLNWQGGVRDNTLDAKLSVGRILHAKADVSNLSLNSQLALTGPLLSPQTVAVQLQLDTAPSRIRVPPFERQKITLHTKIDATADNLKQTLTLRNMTIALQPWLTVGATARVVQLGQAYFDTHVTLQPAPLKQWVALLSKTIPPDTRTRLGPNPVDGKITVGLHAKGKLAPAEQHKLLQHVRHLSPLGLAQFWLSSSPRKIPLQFEASLDLSDGNVSLAIPKVVVHQFSSRNKLTLVPGSVAFDSHVAAQHIRAENFSVTLAALKIPLHVALSANHVTATTGLALASLTHDVSGLSLKGVDWQADAKAFVNVAPPRLDIARPLRFTQKLGIQKIQLAQTGQQIQLQQLYVDNQLATCPQQQHASNSGISCFDIRVNAALEAFRDVNQQLVGGPIRLTLNQKLAFPTANLQQFSFSPAQLSGSTQCRLEIGKIAHPLLAHTQPIDRATVDIAADWSGKNGVKLHRANLTIPAQGFLLQLSGHSESYKLADKLLPRFDLNATVALNNRAITNPLQAIALAKGIRTAGKLQLTVHAQHERNNEIALSTRLSSHRFGLWLRQSSQDEVPSGDFVRTERQLSLEGLNSDVSIKQVVKLRLKPSLQIEPQFSATYVAPASNALYSDMRRYGGFGPTIYFDRLRISERLTALNVAGHLLNTKTRQFDVGPLSVDAAWHNGTLAVRQLRLRLFNGSIAGTLHAQLLSLNPIDAAIALDLQVNRVNLAALNPSADQQDAELSTLASIRYRMGMPQDLSGRVQITNITLRMLDAALAYIDPNALNNSIQQTRHVFSAWYTKLVNPSVKMVSVWFSHGNVNMDIEVDAIPPLGTLLNNILAKNPIRRFSIVSFLPKIGPPK